MKPRALLITEKPSVMEDIKRAYEKIKDSYDYELDFGSCAGHLIGLCEPDEYTNMPWGKPWNLNVLPMLPEKWKTKIINRPFIDKLRNIWDCGNYDYVINAGDSEIEGELIQSLVYDELGVNVPILRYWADDTTEKTIIKTLNNLRPSSEFEGLRQAGYLRMYLDWLIGMNFSRAASCALNRTSAIGRVLTPTLAMIVKRELEIENFVPVDYKTITSTFKYNNEYYDGKLININAKENHPNVHAFLSSEYDKVSELSKELAKITSADVIKVQKKETTSSAPGFMNLSELQKQAARKYGYTPSKTLEIAEELYLAHYLSYPRTESKHLTSAQADDFKKMIMPIAKIGMFDSYVNQIISDSSSITKVANSPKYVNDKKVKDHPALTPTSEIPDVKDLTQNQRNIYTLVVSRFLAPFLPERVTTNITVVTGININEENLYFKTTSTLVKEEGFKKILDMFKDKKEDESDEGKYPVLFKLSEGVTVDKTDDKISDKLTTAPPRFNNASIIVAMETAGKYVDDKDLEKVLNDAKGLGTPATRGEIVKKLFDYDFVERSGQTFVPTEKGMQLIQAIGFDNIITSPELTAEWTSMLNLIRDNQMSYDVFYNQMTDFIKDGVSKLSLLNPLGPYYKVVGSCPVCNKDFIKTSKSYICKGYLDKDADGNCSCKVRIPLELKGWKFTDTDVKTLLEGKITKQKAYTKNDGTKINTSFILRNGELVFPTKDESKVVICKCPVCSRDFIDNGKFYNCDGYYINDNGNRACSFTLPKYYFGATLTTKDIVSMINGKESSVKNFVWSDGSKSKTSIILKDYKISFPQAETVGTCPKCNTGSVLKGKKGYYCSNWKATGCEFSIYYKLGHMDITPSIIREILKNGESEREYKINFDSGKSISGKIILSSNPDTNKDCLAIKPYEPTVLCNCPSCISGKIMNNKFDYRCTNSERENDKCPVLIHKTHCGTKISPDDAIKLLAGEKVQKLVRKYENGKFNGASYPVYVYSTIDEQKGYILKNERISQNNK